MCCLHYSSCQFGDGSYSGFFCFFRKQLYFGSKWVARDKLVFGMKKHGHVSSQILTSDFYNLDFEVKLIINTLMVVSFYIYIYIPKLLPRLPFRVFNLPGENFLFSFRFAWSPCVVSIIAPV